MQGERNTGNGRGHHLAVRLTADHRDAAVLEPPGAARVHTRGSGLAVPWTLLRASHPVAGAYQDDIARSYLDSRLLFPGFEVCRQDRGAVLEMFDALESSDVHQDAARGYAVLESGHGEFLGSGLGYFRLRETVIHSAPDVHMGQ